MRSAGRILAALFVAASLELAAVVGIAVPARALEPADQDEAHAEKTEPSYAGTPLPDDYNPKEAAHPVRIVAAAAHPVGVALDWLIVRPAVWVARHEPFRTIFGFED